MAKIVKKKKKKKIKLPFFTVFIFTVSLFLYLGSSLFLRSYNNSLSLKKQSVEQEINMFITENEALKVSIQELSSRDRIVGIAEGEGLTLNNDNIVTVSTR